MSSTESVKNLDAWKKRGFVVWTLIGVCALVYVFGILASVLSVPVGILIWTVIIVFCLRPIVNWLERHGIGRGWGTTVAFVTMAAVLIGLVVLMVSPMFGINTQFTNLAENLPQYYNALMAWLNDMYAQYSHYLQSDTVKSWIDSAAASLSGLLADMSQLTATGLVSLGSAVASSVMVLGFALVISFWILMDLPHMGAEMMRLIPDRLHEDASMISTTLTTVIGGYIRGTLIQCFLIGLASGICYAIIGLPSAMALAIITGVLNIIPVVGPWLGGGLAALAALMVFPLSALLTFLAAIVVQQVVYTFISPKVMGESVDIHPALMILALMCGSAIGNITGGLGGSIFGMLASIPLVAAAKALFVYYFEKKTMRRLVHPDGVFFRGDVDVESESFVPSADATATRPMPESFRDVVNDRHWRAETGKFFPVDGRGPKTKVQKDAESHNDEE